MLGIERDILAATQTELVNTHPLVASILRPNLQHRLRVDFIQTRCASEAARFEVHGIEPYVSLPEVSRCVQNGRRGSPIQARIEASYPDFRISLVSQALDALISMNLPRPRGKFETLERRELLTVVPELIADIRPGQRGSQLGAELYEYKGELYFSADDGSLGKELWKTDGTEEGTKLVKDIHAGGDNDGSNPGWFVERHAELFFSAADGAGDELWKTDGSAAGTVRVQDINVGDDGSGPADLFQFKDEIFFSASNDAYGNELWSLGSDSGAQLIKDIRAGEADSLPGGYSGFFEFNGHLYFNAQDDMTGMELWRTDGTTAGTERVIDADPGSGSSWPTNFFEFKGDLYFTSEVFNSAFNSFPAHLFRVDGETGVAEQALDIPIDLLEGVTVAGDFMYFSGLDPELGFELFRSDGTEAGTTITRDIMKGDDDSDPRNLFEHNGQIYFAAGDSRDAETQRPVFNLWVTDGSPLGTKKVSPEEIIEDTPFVAYRDEVYYTAFTEDFGWELFKTDGTLAGTSMVYDVNEGPASSFAIPKHVFEDQLLFVAEELSAGYEIWVHDGSTTEMVDVHIGGGDFTDEPVSFQFVEYGNSLVFKGSTPFEGAELFIIRGNAQPPLPRVPGDVDENGLVEFSDFLILSNNFGRENASWSDGDFDGDGSVLFADFLALAANFGASSQIAPATATTDPALATLAVEERDVDDDRHGIVGSDV